MDLRCKYSPTLGIAITGATGYIGTRLLQSLRVDDFSPCSVESVDRGAALVHLGAAVASTRDAMLANLAADSWLIELAGAKAFSKIVYASTNNVYPHAIGCRVDERTRCNDYYSASKVFGEQLFAEFSPVPTVSVRIADVFGMGQRHGNFFKAIEQSLISASPLRKYGAGLKRRTYIHVEDLCGVIRHLIHGNFGKAGVHTIFNAGYGDSASVAEIVGLVAAESGLPIEQVNLDKDCSATDVRTMQVSLPHGFELQWPNFKNALVAYVRQIIAGQR